MVLRRCHVIVVSDASCDPDYKFEDLGNALRKIRIDLGVQITFDDGFHIYSRHDPDQTKKRIRYAIGTINYSKVDKPGKNNDGVLIYIKPTFCGDEPPDVRQYGATVKEFPHETTSDQFFSETQFESYRMLGLHTISHICDKVITRHMSQPGHQIKATIADEENTVICGGL